MSKNSNENQKIINNVLESYKVYPSILATKDIVSTFYLEQFKLQKTDFSKIKQLLCRNIDAKIATGFDSIPPKLVKMLYETIAEPLTTAISNCLTWWVFPKNAKIASVTPRDKGKSNKYDISNYSPVSTLNSFSKIYENVIK